MQTVLLNEIELDIRELKFILDAIAKDPDSPLCEVARRRIQQVQKSLSELSDSLQVPVQQEQVTIAEDLIKAETLQRNDPAIVSETEKISIIPILAENLNLSENLLHSLSINDSFRFSRELFEGHTDRMNETLRRIGEMDSFEAAMAHLTKDETIDKENESYIDFIEVLDKYFNTKRT